MQSKNVIILCFSLFVVGCIAGYLFKDTKIIDNKVEVESYKKTIANLQQRLSKAEKTKTTTLYNNGVITSQVVETQVDTNIDTNTNTTTNEQSKTEQTTHTEINPKNYIIEVGIETNRNVYLHTTIPVFSFISIGSNISTNFNNSFTAGMGLAVRF